jgi:hypothetical protein
MIEILLSVLVVAATLTLIVSPFVRGVEESADAADRVALETAKQAKYREIRDAEIDYRAGKLNEQEWRETDDDLRREALAILAEIDEAEDSNSPQSQSGATTH